MKQNMYLFEYMVVIHLPSSNLKKPVFSADTFLITNSKSYLTDLNEPIAY